MGPVCLLLLPVWLHLETGREQFMCNSYVFGQCGMFLISRVFDLLSCVRTYVNDALTLHDESAARVSPQRILMKMSPTICCPVVVVVEEHGSPEFTRQSKEFADVLKSHGVKSSFLELPGVDHFDIIENMVNPEDYLCKEILKVV